MEQPSTDAIVKKIADLIADHDRGLISGGEVLINVFEIINTWDLDTDGK